MPETNPPKRRRILVDPELQIGISVRIVGWIYLYFLGFAVLANSPALWAILTEPAGGVAHDAALDQVRGFARFVVLPLGLTFVAMAIHGVFITHRFAGPIVRMKRVLREIAAHRIPDAFRLRDKDSFQDLADEMNAATATLRDDAARRRRLAQEHVTEVRRLVESLEKAPEDLAEALTRAYAALDGAERLDRHLAPPSDAASTDAPPVSTADAPLQTSTAPVGPTAQPAPPAPPSAGTQPDAPAASDANSASSGRTSDSAAS